MDYHIKDCHSISDEIRRIAEEQVTGVIEDIDDPGMGDNETVHSVRKRFKRLRGLIRMGRSPLERGAKKNHYQLENVRYRDAGRELSLLRDADALCETLEKLINYIGEDFDQKILRDLEGKLELRSKSLVEKNSDIKEKLQICRAQMLEAKEQIPKWSKRIRSIESLLAGFTKTYGRARKCMKFAYKHGTNEGFHEWRKRVKYHRYHCRILHQAWPEVMIMRRDETKRLTDLLGDEHDLTVLYEVVASEHLVEGKSLKAIQALIKQRQDELRALAHPLGERLFAEKPQHFALRMAAYCQAWEETADADD